MKFVVKSDESIEGYTKLKRTYPEIEKLIKKYTREYKKSKKGK